MPRCRRSKGTAKTNSSLISVREEPFRIFFPLAALSGALGVALWPLHLLGASDWYPGLSHAKMMVNGFFGGFILGFLGTAGPRLLSAPRMTWPELLTVLGLYLAGVAAYASGSILIGDRLFLVLFLLAMVIGAVRFSLRKDMPPPGFVLVALALGCGAAAAGISGFLDEEFTNPQWIVLGRLLGYQCFVLLPVMGVGVFLFPRIFGVKNRQVFEDSRSPDRPWKLKACTAAAAGAALVATCFLEAWGWHRTAATARALVFAAYVLMEVRFDRATRPASTLSRCLLVGLVFLVAGYLSMAWMPEQRVAWLHLGLAAGIGFVTLTVAARVSLAHSGHSRRLEARNRWMIVALSLMFLGVISRMSGDFMPRIQATHYNYGAACWIAGLIVWAGYILPRMTEPDDSGTQEIDPISNQQDGSP